MSDLWPRLSDLRLSFDMLSRVSNVWGLSDAEFRALMSLVGFSAAGLVWTYSPPSDGSIPDDDKTLARICGERPAKWRKLRPAVAEFFVIADGRWHLKEPWIAVDDRPVRLAIPAAIRIMVEMREGRRCTYCGTTEGPFHFDHILPVSKGGTNDASNLTLACADCNLAKGGLTLAEWVERRR